jgi:Flp pilus assembly pilin Flp
MRVRNLLRRLWSDDEGALIATEWIFFVTIVVIGLITGLVYVRNAVTSELSEIGQAIVALSQSYSFQGLTGCKTFQGETFTVGSVVTDAVSELPEIVSDSTHTNIVPINDAPCF